MRNEEACSSSSPNAAAISFTYSTYGYVHRLPYAVVIMAIITHPSGTPAKS